MIRKIIKIDKDKCNGCGLCATACHEGAIEMIDGKAHLARENFCDGFGDCLPACPTGAISFEEREAPEYDEVAVNAAKSRKITAHTGCPGMAAKTVKHTDAAPDASAAQTVQSRLSQWPVQIKLVSPYAEYFDGADLLISADCAAYAYGNFHNDFIKNRITVIGCPKLDGVDYTEKLTEIIKSNNIKSVTVVRMQVPCCGGIENAAKNAIKNSGKFIPWHIVTISNDGRILSD